MLIISSNIIRDWISICMQKHMTNFMIINIFSKYFVKNAKCTYTFFISNCRIFYLFFIFSILELILSAFRTSIYWVIKYFFLFLIVKKESYTEWHLHALCIWHKASLWWNWGMQGGLWFTSRLCCLCSLNWWIQGFLSSQGRHLCGHTCIRKTTFPVCKIWFVRVQFIFLMYLWI